MTLELITARHQGYNNSSQLCERWGSNTQQNDCRRSGQTACEQQLTEVVVVTQEHATFVARQLQETAICCARKPFCDKQYVVARAA